MLYGLKWLQPNKPFPPTAEKDRIERYKQNAALFDGDQFDSSKFRHRDSTSYSIIEMYDNCARRISKVVGNFGDVISFPVLLNYQRLMTLKMADLVCGEYPSITGADSEANTEIRDVRESSDFDSKLFTTVIDISRYGDAVWRMYRDEETDKETFTVWDAKEWFPVVANDGTNRITHHCICWRVNINAEDPRLPQVWELHVQIHGTAKNEWGRYTEQVYKMDGTGTQIGEMIKSEQIKTGLKGCAVQHVKSYEVSNSIYGYDDYMPLDSLLAEIMVRVSQIAAILDKHADPNITGPASMLELDPVTGEYKLGTGKFFAINPGETPPSYMTWDGQLTASFKQLEVLINQLYILSEMGAALLGSTDGGSQAISGTAMRFKMVNPLAKARRISNSLTLPVKRLFECLSRGAIASSTISIGWKDGLPDDPRENIEIAKLATGATQMMPLEDAIREYLNRSEEEALLWIDKIDAEKQKAAERMLSNQNSDNSDDSKDDDNPNKPGPQDGTGVNPQAKGSETGLNNFKGLNNHKGDDK